MGSIIDPSDDLVRRRRTFAQRRSLSEYAVSLPSQPADAIGIHPRDDKFRFFKSGRDFQPRQVKHQFTEDELRVLETYESSAILPSHSEVYRKWLKENKSSRGGLETWGILCLVAVMVGTLAFFLRLVCEKFQIIYLPWIQNSLESNNTLHLWIFFTIASCASSALAAMVVILFCPQAAGSGLAEIIGILNGCVVRNVLNVKTLVCKMISVMFVVISKLPVGSEGPMVHIGAMVGACMAKPMKHCYNNDNKASTHDQNGCCPKGCLSRLCRYRDCQERYSLICVGAASGVASAFSSPISGLTFAMEEISSHWSRKQTWRTFVCCILARSTTELLHSFETTIEKLGSHQHKINIFQLSESALFDMRHNLSLSMLIFIPALIIGALGGLFGAIFIFIHLKASKFRRKLFSYIASHHVQNALKLLEVLIITTICASFVVGVLPLFPCKTVQQQEVSLHGRSTLGLRSFNCHVPLQSSVLDDHGKITQSGEYNEGASLLLGSWEQMLRSLLSRKTANVFGIPALATCLLFFWIFSCWASMTNISCGLLIPQLAIGALFGRIIGELLHSRLQGVMDSYENVGWEWVDPGAFALMGAASFLSGTSRLPITSVVMMVEMSNDVNMSLLVMVCVMVSKFVGDLFTHSLYHSALEIKCIPYLEPDLTVYDHEGHKVSLELFTSSTVMQFPVQIVVVKESVRFLANLLLDTNHGAFPVVSNDDGMQRTYLGIITRLELTILLTKTERFDPHELEKDDIDRLRISYPEYSSTKLKNTATANMVLNKYSSNIVYKNIYVNLEPYINVSAPSVSPNFCLKRTYMMFTAMGLRHLVVTDRLNQVVGIITRKDLMGFSVEAKIRTALLRNKISSLSTSGDSVGVDCDIQVQSTVPIVEEEENEGIIFDEHPNT